MSDLKLKPRKAFLQDELNIERLTHIQWYGIIRAMQKYAEHYHEVQQQANGAETSAEPSLHKHDVSQQRELLFKFHSWYNDEYATSALDSNRIVDEYIKTNSA